MLKKIIRRSCSVVFRVFILAQFVMLFSPPLAVSNPAVIAEAVSNAALLMAQTETATDDKDLWEEGDAETDGDKDAGSTDDVWNESPDAGGAADDAWDESPAAASNEQLFDEAVFGEETDSLFDDDSEKRRVEITGRLWNKFASDTNEDDRIEDDLFNHAEFQIGVKYVPNDRFHAVVSVAADYFQYYNADDWDYDDSVRLHSAYVNWSSAAFNLKMGNQVVRWGKTDGYSPLDNLNPEDFRDGIAGRREDRKLPIPILSVELYRGNMSLQGVFLPVFVEPELDTLGTDWALFQHADQELSGYHIDEEDPAHTMENSEVGLRLAGIIRSIDYAVSWLHTREDLPSPDSLTLPDGFLLPPGKITIDDLLRFSGFTGQPVFFKHKRQNIYGLEFESTLGDFGVRGDVAYFDRSSFFTHDLRRLSKPVGQCMVGIDYNGPEAWYVNLQFFQSYIFDYDDRILWTDEVVSAMIGTLSKEFLNGNLKPECRFYYDFSGDAAMLNPKLKISYWEPIIVEFGAELFDGSEENALGRSGENDQVYVSVAYNF